MTTAAYDVLVVGSGQGGTPFAREAARAGRRTALVERAHVGGTCVNEGCTPSKTMIASARVAHLVRRGRDYGVDTGDVRIDVERVVARKRHVVDSFRASTEQGLAAAGVDVIAGEARFVGERTVEVTVAHAPPRRLSAEVVVVNTGLRSAIPEVAGLSSVPYHTSTSIMELTHVPEHLVVLGGGYVGLELGQMFRRFGSRVTIVQRGAQLMTREDADVAAAIARLLREDGIDVLLETEVAAVSGRDEVIDVELRPRGSATAPRSVRCSHLLVATGRRPNTDALTPSMAGVELDAKGYIVVDERLRTSARGVFAMGDVNGGPAFTHISYDDFRILRATLLAGGDLTTKGRLVPYTVFTDPQLGRIGMTEKDARDAGRRIHVARLPMATVARAIEVDETRGFMKAIVDADSARILGAAVLGLEGGEVASMLQLAMMGNLPYTSLRDGIFSHPTLSESLNNLFMAMDRDS